MNLEILYLSFNLADLVELVVYESNGELWENTTLTSRFSLNKQRNGNNWSSKKRYTAGQNPKSYIFWSTRVTETFMERPAKTTSNLKPTLESASHFWYSWDLWWGEINFRRKKFPEKVKKKSLHLHRRHSHSINNKNNKTCQNFHQLLLLQSFLLQD